MRGRCCAAWLVLVACGRLGFEPVDQQQTTTDASLYYCYDPKCDGAFTCCEPEGVRCIANPDEACQGQIGQCMPVSAGCLPSELCCILTSAPYFQCVPENAGIC